jgi:hypothetical protein
VQRKGRVLTPGPFSASNHLSHVLRVLSTDCEERYPSLLLYWFSLKK